MTISNDLGIKVHAGKHYFNKSADDDSNIGFNIKTSTTLRI
jgi:hypothetical protein